MITTIKAFKESILVPRNIEGREDKRRQNNYALLQQETIEGDLEIDKSWIFDNPIVKTRKIRGNVEIIDLDHIPLWLENIEIEGFFLCEHNDLTTLKGCPKRISGDFYASYNKLENLKYGPIYVGGSYYVNGNYLTSLEGAPKEIEYGDFACNLNNLSDLKGAPKLIGNNFECSENKLTSFEGCPKEIWGDFIGINIPGDHKIEDIVKISKVHNKIYLS